MIEFTDITIREAMGNYNTVKEIMAREDIVSDNWMLRSSCTVFTNALYTEFVLHFWYNGSVVIYDTTHSIAIDSTEDDLRMLSDWCKLHGWKHLSIHDRLLKSSQDFDYWMRQYIKGIVVSEVLKSYEDSETNRFKQLM